MRVMFMLVVCALLSYGVHNFNVDTSRPYLMFKGDEASYFGFSTQFYDDQDEKW